MGFFKQPNKAATPADEPKGTDAQGGVYALSTPFMQIGEGNLSLPYINPRSRRLNAVAFGADNLFPQLINQMKLSSPLHGSIIDYKVRATVGGGYTYKPKNPGDMDCLVASKKFELKYNLKNLVNEICEHGYMHERFYRIIEFQMQNGRMIPIDMHDVSAEEVRVCVDKTTYVICPDWSTMVGAYSIKKYHPNNRDLKQLFVYERKTIGQRYYPIPTYTSANNWFFLDGEMSFLHKTNIQESIFPSFAVTFMKKTVDDKEAEKTAEKIQAKKGAKGAGKIWVFFAGSKETAPEIKEIPKNNNDQLFIQTDGRIDEKICQAHTIDPLLMGIRVSGKLGSGTDIQQSYTIFEKNQVIPMRCEVEDIVRELMRIFNVPAEFELNNFQIINETIVQVEDEEGTVAAIGKLPAELQKAAIAGMTVNEIRAFVRMKPIEGGDVLAAPPGAPAATEGEPVAAETQVQVNENLKGLSAAENMDIQRITRDFKKGKLGQLLAITRLAAYGIPEEMALQILEIE